MKSFLVAFLFCAGVLTAWAQIPGPSPFRTIPVVFAALPSCSAGLEGSIAAVTDSNTVTWGATIAGSSTNHVLAYCNGTNWTVAGK